MAQSLVAFIFSVQSHLKLYHWTTTSFSRHKAMDELVEVFSTQSDRFVENYIGKYGRTAGLLFGNPAAVFDISIAPLNDGTVVAFLKASIHFFTRQLPKHLQADDDADLLTIRDEIVAALNKARYLCTLR